MFDHASRRDVVRSLGAAAGATAVVGGFAGSATAHFPPKLAVEVRPGVTPNRINPDSDGFTAVGVLATEEFDPAASPVRYRFGAPELVAEGRGPRSVHHEARDIDGDGREDLLLQFPTDDAELGGEEVAELRWDRGRNRLHGLSGTDDVTPFPITGSRRGDGSVFTGGQVERVELVPGTFEPVAVRDRIPASWTVVDGDLDRSRAGGPVEPTFGDAKHVYLAPSDGSATYFVEVPSGPEATGEYSFGPFEVRPREGSGGWVAASNTSSRERVVGPEQP